jgi:hypothetical protein
MAYGHAERNLALIRQLEAETEDLLGTLKELDPEQSAWWQDHHPSGRDTVSSRPRRRPRRGRPWPHSHMRRLLGIGAGLRPTPPLATPIRTSTT